MKPTIKVYGYYSSRLYGVRKKYADDPECWLFEGGYFCKEGAVSIYMSYNPKSRVDKKYTCLEIIIGKRVYTRTYKDIFTDRGLRLICNQFIKDAEQEAAKR